MNFRKTIGFLLASLILLSNLGLQISLHYCQEEFVGISFLNATFEPCAKKNSSCCEKVSSHKDCCSNKELKIEKNSTDFVLKSHYFDLDFCFFSKNNYTNLSFKNTLKKIDSETAFYCESNAPPLYKLYCQFIFYA